jgi:hypothetical protein
MRGLPSERNNTTRRACCLHSRSVAGGLLRCGMCSSTPAGRLFHLISALMLVAAVGMEALAQEHRPIHAGRLGAKHPIGTHPSPAGKVTASSVSGPAVKTSIGTTLPPQGNSAAHIGAAAPRNSIGTRLPVQGANNHIGAPTLRQSVDAKPPLRPNPTAPHATINGTGFGRLRSGPAIIGGPAKTTTGAVGGPGARSRHL